MKAFSFFYTIFGFLIFPAILTTLPLYFYPFGMQCEFPRPVRTSDPAEQAQCIFDSGSSSLGSEQPKSTTPPKKPLPAVAPFRLLVFADPQLEGDTSLPEADAPLFHSLFNVLAVSPANTASRNLEIVRETIVSFFTKDVLRPFQFYRKRLDLFGNDFYLAHIYRALHWYLKPTHMTVLGDLLGSQWISDEEFERRGDRFWGRVFRGAKRIDDEYTQYDADNMYLATGAWSKMLINVAGNHDVGYAGDISAERMERYERKFGKTNWDARFSYPTMSDMQTASLAANTQVASLTGHDELRQQPNLRIVALNSMNLDAPALDSDLQKQTYDHLNHVMSSADPVEDRHSATVLLTHIPLYKPMGVCVDGPFFQHHEDGSIREQNHLSEHSSKNILEGVYGLNRDLINTPNGGRGRKGIILNGHDHYGCDTYHHLDRSLDLNNKTSDDYVWTPTRWLFAEKNAAADKTLPGMREITVRSMMGEFGGNVGMLSAWFDEEEGEWEFGYGTCPFIIQHIWWAVHVLDIVTLSALLLGLGFEAKFLIEEREEEQKLSTEAGKKSRQSQANGNGKSVRVESVNGGTAFQAIGNEPALRQRRNEHG